MSSLSWAALKTVLIAFGGAALEIISKQGLPQTMGDWVSVAVAAGAAAGLYHLPSPSMQAK